MSWLKLDDSFFRNPKVREVDAAARLLYLAALCYCGAQLTDGHVSTRSLPLLAIDADVDDVDALAAQLVAAGLWHAVAGGYQVHDYLAYNPSREQVLAARAAARARMAAHRRRDGARSRELQENFAGSSPYSREREVNGVGEEEEGEWEEGSGEEGEREEGEAPIYAALCAVTDTRPATTSEIEQYEAAAAEILAADPRASPAEIARRAANYPRHFPGAALTARALARYWGRCAKAPPDPVPFVTPPESGAIAYARRHGLVPP